MKENYYCQNSQFVEKKCVKLYFRVEQNLWEFVIVFRGLKELIGFLQQNNLRMKWEKGILKTILNVTNTFRQFFEIKNLKFKKLGKEFATFVSVGCGDPDFVRSLLICSKWSSPERSFPNWSDFCRRMLFLFFSQNSINCFFPSVRRSATWSVENSFTGRLSTKTRITITKCYSFCSTRNSTWNTFLVFLARNIILIHRLWLNFLNEMFFGGIFLTNLKKWCF